ncbi:MAG: NERD domain-containing protein, partial [Proteobacteria bacterium]|nr:NERD domain-containing protein [Pseudomonadota bacterium]
MSVSWLRWRKKAIEDSCKQIYGAERRISNSTNVITKEGKVGLPFPPVSCRRIHRVAIALGSKGKVPFSFGDFGKGFVHVFDEISLNSIMNELDTISDFVKYLIDKESLYSSKVETCFKGGEEDLLALYLQNGRNFPSNYDLIIIDDNLWVNFTKKREYHAKKEADKVSYVWDRLIEIFCNDFQKEGLEFGNSLTEVEKVTRVMAQ